MKKPIKDIAIGAIVCISGLLLISALAGCQPGIGDILAYQPPIIQLDTVEIVTERTVTDTFLLAGEQVPFFDSILCPPGLVESQYFYLHDTVRLPAKYIPYTVTVRDTFLQYVQLPGTTVTKDLSWPERLTWLSGILAFLVGWWKKWKDEQKTTTPAA